MTAANATQCDNPTPADTLTTLITRGPLLCKQWNADGTITGHGQAKHHTIKTYPINNLREAASVLELLRPQHQTCVVLGDFIGFEAMAKIDDPERKGKYIRRTMQYFRDVAHHLLVIDVDKYMPMLSNPDTEPLEAIKEFIQFHLPPEFRGRSFWWQLSGSAGHPSKAGTLNAHLAFWTGRAQTSAERHAWATLYKIPVDRAFFHPVQALYFADPMFADGVADPVPVRSGFFEGESDVVELVIDEAALAQAMTETRRIHTPGEASDAVDPRTKRGLVGAFCRAFSIEDVLMADWFKGRFERVSDRRLTWLDGNGAAEGAYLTDDGFKLVNTHNTAPLDTMGKGLNSWDLVRVYNFGELDEAVPEADRWVWTDDPMSRPSDQAMRAWAKTLPEVQLELEQDDRDNPFTPEIVEAACQDASTPPVVIDPWGKALGKKVGQALHVLGCTDDEIKRIVDGEVLRAAWLAVFYRPANQKLYMLNRAGDLTEYPQARWAKAVQTTFGKFLVPEVLAEVAKRIAEETGTKEHEVRKELIEAVWKQFEHHVVVYRQRSELRYEVDIFATKPRMIIEATQVAIIYSHVALPVVETGLAPEDEAAIIAEYKAFFPEFDDVLVGLILSARFASDRREASLWHHASAGWGKGFLLDGILGRDGLGLVCLISMKDIERALEGAPVGLMPSELLRAWVLGIDEFRGVKAESKMLNNGITISPKNQMRATFPLFVKYYTSAEGVPSLAGPDGVEGQFADRYSLVESLDGRRLDEQPLFLAHGKYYYRRVLANYAAKVLNEGVERMRALGRDEATRQGDIGLSAFHAKYAIDKTYGKLDDSLPEIADDLASIIRAWGLRDSGNTSPINLERSLKRDLKEALASSVTYFSGGRFAHEARDNPLAMVSVRRLDTLVRTYIKSTVDTSQQAMLLYKTSEIARLIAGHDRKAPTRHYALEEDGSVRAMQVKGGALLTLDVAVERHQPGEKKVIDFPVR